MFNLEDKVIVINNEYPQLVGKIGIVKELSSIKNGKAYGVVLEEFNSGHDLDGRCEFGHGWYLLEGEIELENKSKLCRMIAKDEDLLKMIKESKPFSYDKLFEKSSIYNVRKNGALTFLTKDERKVFVYKDGAPKPLILNCISEDDRIVTLHLMEAFRILPMHTIYESYAVSKYILGTYTQKESDEHEAKMLPVDMPVQETVESPITMPVFEAGKKYETEEELYALMGFTKK